MITQELRNKTAENHVRLEQSSVLLPFSEGNLTKEKYITILKKFYGFFGPLESALSALPVDNYLPDYESRRKAEWLKKDLELLLGEKYAVPALCSSLPVIENMCQAMGCLYVMEGSTLGGKLIYKRVQAELGLDYTSGASFFYGYGNETGNKWKAFQQALINYSSSFPASHDIITTANDTFARFKQWLDIHP